MAMLNNQMVIYIYILVGGLEHVLFFHILGMSISIVYYNGNDSPQPFRFIADLGFFRVPAAAVPWHFWSSFLLLAFWPFGSFCFFGRVLIFYPCGKIVTIRHSFSYLLMTIMFLCAGDGCTSCCMYKYIVVFFKQIACCFQGKGERLVWRSMG